MRLIPPAWTALIAAGTRGLVQVAGGPRDYPGRRPLTVGLAAAGIGLMGTGAWQFYRARTTIDPRAPHEASTLVSTGVFGVSRNPIYIADTLMLAAHAAWTGRPWALLGIPALVAVLQQQIRAEEAALTARFGSEYESYVARVPRWIGPRG